jgi:hypothetical protein
MVLAVVHFDTGWSTLWLYLCRRDHPLHEPAANRFIHAGRNAHQEYNMFQLRHIPAYVCQDVFVFHNKSATASPLTRAAMEHNKLQVNKKGAIPGQQS